jgi:uncharacterized integral membrane protein
MFRRIVIAIVLLPITAVLVGFAVANRESVLVSFDPFNGADPARSAAVPLYLLIFGVLIAGVVLGGVAAWLEQGKWRRARSRLAAELRGIRSELEEYRQRAAAREVRPLPPTALPRPASKRPPAA